MSRQPAIALQSDGRWGFRIQVGPLDPSFIAAIGEGARAVERLASALRVNVVEALGHRDDDLPDVFGQCQVSDSSFEFVPRLPFDPGVLYRATFNPRGLGGLESMDAMSLDFSLPRAPEASPVVEQIFPTSDCLPENLLRLYVCFSKPMRRGAASEHIAILGPDGNAMSDVLYRAPVELWDKGMTRLTVLLDPGRLKRGVGPNRALGPPLLQHEEYTLAIGTGMIDLAGLRLRETFHKRFRVTEAVRERIAVEQWQTSAPSAHTYEPLVIAFPRALDSALVTQSLSVVLEDRCIEGAAVIGPQEKSWIFTPALAWAPGTYRVEIASDLEDVCGNDLLAAFDRPLGSVAHSVSRPVTLSVPFRLG